MFAQKIKCMNIVNSLQVFVISLLTGKGLASRK